MGTTDKFEDTYGTQTQEKVEFESDKIHIQTETTKTAQKTSSGLFLLGRWIFMILLVAAGLFVGGIFAIIALGIFAVFTVLSFLGSLFTSGPGSSMTRRY